METARVITVSQILEGDERCHCGEPAVLVVDTEPDNDPGPVCYVHGRDWIGAATSTLDGIFGPKTSTRSHP